MKKIAFTLALFVIASANVAAKRAPAHYWGNGPFKVLLEVNQNNLKEWKITIANLATMEKVVGMDTAHAEVIAWGPGLKMLMKHSPVAKDIKSLAMYGVQFSACGQTMKHMHVTKSQLADGVTVVPGAMAEIVKRHAEGWAEIKE